MAYTQPPVGALAFVFVNAPYTPPTVTEATFDLAAGNTAGQPTRVPGVIAAVGLGYREAITAIGETRFIFGGANERGAASRMSARSASVQLTQRLTGPFGLANNRARSSATPWGKPPTQEIESANPHKQAPKKDQNLNAPYSKPSSEPQHTVAPSFLVLTPQKDTQAISPHRDSNLTAPLFRITDFYPELYIKALGGADFTLDDPRAPGSGETIIVLGDQWAGLPEAFTQPKDYTFTGAFISGPGKKDVGNAIPWGPSGRRDTTLDWRFTPGYSGPIDLPGAPYDTFIIPTQRIYIVTNSAQIIRVSDGRDVPAQAVTISSSSDSFAWTLNATLAGKDAGALVEGTDGEPVECDVTINGATWRFIMDGWRRGRSFNQRQTTIQGRSRTILLANPYAERRDFRSASTVTAAQLASDELSGTGFATTWLGSNWIVDAGSFEYQGKTPIDAINQIAEAGANFLHTTRDADVIEVRSLYPDAPWNWSGVQPHYDLPSAILTRTASDKRPGLGVNGVYVHGQDANGVLAWVRRGAGDILAPTIVNRLVTDQTPAEKLGIAAIAASQRQSLETLELPISANWGGVLGLGKYLRVDTTWTGIIRAITVTAAASRQRSGASLSVRQSVTVERHYEN